MLDNNTPPPIATGTAVGIPIRTTIPDELLRHDISDEELDNLGDNQRGFFHEFMWSALTGGAGAAWGAIDAIHGAYWVEKPKPLTGFQVWEILVFAGFLVLAVFSACLVVREGKRKSGCLKDQIRARTKSRLGMG